MRRATSTGSRHPVPVSTIAHSSVPRMATSARTSARASAASSSDSAATGSRVANASTATSAPSPNGRRRAVSSSGCRRPVERLGEHVARQPPLRVAGDPQPHELERDDGRGLLQDEPLEVPEVVAADPGQPRLRGSAVAADDRQHERPPAQRFRDAAAGGDRRLQRLALGGFERPAGGDRLATPAQHARAAADRLGDHPHDLAEPALLEHEPLQALLDRRAAPQRVVLLADEVREGAFGDRDERQLVGHLEDRQRMLARGVEQRGGQRAVLEADAEPDAGDPVRGEPRDVLALALVRLQLAAGRQQQLAAGQPRGRVQQLRAVDRAHRRRGRRMPGRQLEPGLAQQTRDGQHRR